MVQVPAPVDEAQEVLGHEQVRQLSQRLSRVHPRRLLNEKLQYLDDLQGQCVRNLKLGWRHYHTMWHSLALRLWRLKPSLILVQRRHLLAEAARRFLDISRLRLQDRRHRLANLEARLRILSPQNVLSRGYSITRDAASGRIIRAAKEVKASQLIKTKLHQGEITSIVEK